MNQTLSYSIDIVSLSKKFKRHTVRGSYTTIKSSLLGIFGNGKQQNSYTKVLEDITLRIPNGASVGIIGKNGSGKSTLLKLITGIYKPDFGTVSVTGRVAALIELGAGFHPDFSGRENIYLGGVMHGMTRKEIDECFEEIVHFAELEDVIDDPVRTYSSGMFMRLGFSLAVHTNPDVLLVDEVLAVGDARFVAKCKDKVAELRRCGKTLLLVTHDLEAVELWCDEALWLHDGKVQERGDPRRVIDTYRQFVEHSEEEDLILTQADAETIQDGESHSDDIKPQRWGSREIEITNVRLLDSTGKEHFVFHSDSSATIEISYSIHQEVSDVVFGISINRNDGLVIHGTNTDIERVTFPKLQKNGIVTYHIPRIGLLDGMYSLDAAVHRSDGYPYDYHKTAVKFSVRWPQRQAGVFVPEHRWDIR